MMKYGGRRAIYCRVSANTIKFLGLWSTYRGTSGAGDEVFPTDLAFLPVCAKWNSIGGLEKIITYSSNKTKHYIYYTIDYRNVH